MEEYDHDPHDAELARSLMNKNKRSGGKNAGAPESGLPADASSGGSGAGITLIVLLGVALASGLIACALAGWSIHNDHKIEHALKNEVAPALEYAFNISQAADLGSQTYCTDALRHIAAGTPPTGTLFLAKREVAMRELYEKKRAAAEELFNRNARSYGVGTLAYRPPSFEYPEYPGDIEERGIPLANTRLPGTTGTVSIVRVGSTVHIKFTATALPSNLSVPVPYWEVPDDVSRLSSYIPYECIPPIAAWPNCNVSILGVATCEDIETGGPDHPVFYLPGQEVVGSTYHTHITNGLGWFAGNHVVHSASISANGYDGDTDTYLIGMQTDIFTVTDGGMFDAHMFSDLRAEVFYKTDAPVDWTVPESCLAECYL